MGFFGMVFERTASMTVTHTITHSRVRPKGHREDSLATAQQQNTRTQTHFTRSLQTHTHTLYVSCKSSQLPSAQS